MKILSTELTDSDRRAKIELSTTGEPQVPPPLPLPNLLSSLILTYKLYNFFQWENDFQSLTRKNYIQFLPI